MYTSYSDIMKLFRKGHGDESHFGQFINGQKKKLRGGYKKRGVK